MQKSDRIGHGLVPHPALVCVTSVPSRYNRLVETKTTKTVFEVNYMTNIALPDRKTKSVSYKKWGYIFILPFFVAFAIFTFYPLLTTFYNSFFENYMVGLKQVGPTFVGFENYVKILTEGELFMYLANTGIMWIAGFIPQLAISLLLAAWFTDLRLRLKTGFFKTVNYMPNLIMASAFSMLFFSLFSDNGPINSILVSFGMEPFRFFANVTASRGLVALMNFLLWFGNTTILLMAGIMGIDPALFESAQIDGARPWQVFRKVTLPLIRPILVYVLITSMIGGLQMFDVPQILTNGNGAPDRQVMTIIMWLNSHLFSKNLGIGGAISVLLFIVTAALSGIVYKVLNPKDVLKEKRVRKGAVK